MTVTNTEFNSIMTEVGEDVTKVPRTAGAADGFGEPTYSDAATSTFKAIVQDVSANQLRQYAGILEIGDKVVFVKSDVNLVPTDELTIGGLRYVLVIETTEQVKGSVIFREYVIRRKPT